MGREIERKFLVSGDSWRAGAQGIRLVQGYLSAGEGRAVRVRLEGSRGVLTIKGPTKGIERLEFEYEVPAADADQMLTQLCLQPLITKVRYRVPVGGHVWDVDEFDGVNHGLILAELELTSAEEAFERPPWVGREVSGDARYFNSQLCRRPYTTWDSDGDELR